MTTPTEDRSEANLDVAAATPSEGSSEPTAGALPPMPSTGAEAALISQNGSSNDRSRDLKGNRGATASVVRGAPVTPDTSVSFRRSLKRMAAPAAAFVGVIVVALVAAALAFRTGDEPTELVVQEAEPVVLAAPDQDGSRYATPVLVTDGEGVSSKVWEVTVGAPRIVTSEAAAFSQNNKPRPDHEFLAVPVAIKLVATAWGSEIPPTDWRIEGATSSARIDLPYNPIIDVCNLPNGPLALSLDVGESTQGTLCVEVRKSDIPGVPVVLMMLDGRAVRFEQ